MNLINVDGQLVNVAQQARNCPTLTLRRAYVRALREWCQQTQWLRTNVAGQTIAEQREYTLGSDPDFDICGVFAMMGSFTTPTGVQKWAIVPSDSTMWDPNMPPGIPGRFQYIPEGQFALDLAPKAVYDLLVTVILMPKEAAVNVPRDPLAKYSNDIEAGALQYLQMVPGQPWSNPQLAELNGRKFQAGIANGKAEAQRSYNVGSQRARPRQILV